MNTSPHSTAFSAMTPVLLEMHRQQIETPAQLLADAWREGHRTVDAMLRAIRQDRRIIREQYQEIIPGRLRHSRQFVQQTHQDLKNHLRRYAEAVRVVSEAEAEMDRRGIAYAVSSDHWSEDPMFAASVFCDAMGAV